MLKKVKKYLVFGTKGALSDFLKRAQDKEVIQCVDDAAIGDRALSLDIEMLVDSLKALRKFNRREQVSIEDVDVLGLSEEIVGLRKKEHALEEKIAAINAEAARVAPLGEFSVEDIRKIEEESGRVIQFFYKNKSKKVQPLDDMIFLNTQGNLEYFMLISSKKQHIEHFIEMDVTESVITLRKHREQSEKAVEEINQKLSKYTQYYQMIQNKLCVLTDKNALVKANHSSHEHLSGLYSLEIWVPEHKRDIVYNIASDLPLCLEGILKEKKDHEPTYLENKKMGKVGEDVIKIYDIPSTEDKDPSMWVLSAFAIFYSMIISDAGYGLIYFILGFILYRKWRPLEGFKKRFFKLLLLLSSCTVIWGIGIGSYFSIDKEPHHPLNKISFFYYLAKAKTNYIIEQKDTTYQEALEKVPELKNVTDSSQFLQDAYVVKDGHKRFFVMDNFYENIFLELSLIAGIIHILLSHLWNLRRSLSGIGWSLFLIGGYLFFPTMLKATSMVNFIGHVSPAQAAAWGKEMLFSGIILAVVLALIQHKKSGLSEIMRVIEIFADVLSYLRLFALGLASMIMATTFNQLGADFGLFFGFFILLCGHGVNIVLGIMGGVIHGLRLNFLEWYRHCFEGGGRLFNPLRKVSR